MNCQNVHVECGQLVDPKIFFPQVYATKLLELHLTKAKLTTAKTIGTENNSGKCAACFP